jgi:hypothetical protein
MPTPKPSKLAKGLWRWTERHPEWHPGEFGAEVACFAVDAGEDTLLIDPLLPADPEPVHALIESMLGDRLTIFVTIPYHVRSAEPLWQRYRGQAETTIRGHRACAKRLDAATGSEAMTPDSTLPAGVTAHRIGNPRRYETPLHLPTHRALVFGDAVAEHGGKLRVWSGRKVDDEVKGFYRERFNPTLEPLLELDFDRVLVTHGEPVMKDGRRELAGALRRQPWYHHG